MTKLTYEEAVKQAKAEKPRENYLEVCLDGRFVFPYKDGMALMQSMANAEKVGRTWSTDPAIGPIDESTIECKPMSAHQYQRRKIAALMGVSLDDLRRAEEAAAQPTPEP